MEKIRKSIVLCVAIALVALCLCACGQAGNTPTAAPVASAFRIALDNTSGMLTAVYGSPDITKAYADNKAIWDKAEKITPSTVINRNPDTSADVYLMWDEDAMYFCYIVKDPDIDTASSNSYEQDSIEFMIDFYSNGDVFTFNEKMGQLRCSAAGTTTVVEGNESIWSAKTETTEEGYIVQGSVKWIDKALGKDYVPDEGCMVRVEMQINCCSDGSRTAFIRYGDVQASAIVDVSLFSDCLLTKK